MSLEILEVLDIGLGATIQGRRRVGWRKYGVPSSGPMDDHAAAWANQLLENAPGTPVVEFLFQGAQVRVRDPIWIAITGADAGASVPMWRTIHIGTDQVIRFAQNRCGVWIYLAVEGGFQADEILGSVSVYPRGGLGKPLRPGEVLKCARLPSFQLVAGVGSRVAPWSERRDYLDAPSIGVWPGPQWECFTDRDRALFFDQAWTVSPQSDRMGYRLTGAALGPLSNELLSEPMLVGTVQVPNNGLPIVTMRDGPTVGGYAKLAVVNELDLSWLAQCRPGQRVRFKRLG